MGEKRMKQVIPNSIKKDKPNRKKKPKSNYKAYHGGKPFRQRRKTNQKYGTSKLEIDFARDFLDRMNLTYIYEYEAVRQHALFLDNLFSLSVYQNHQIEYMNTDSRYYQVLYTIRPD